MLEEELSQVAVDSVVVPIAQSLCSIVSKGEDIAESCIFEVHFVDRGLFIKNVALRATLFKLVNVSKNNSDDFI